MRAGQFPAFGCIFHKSSHLSNEFLLRKENTKFERVNLSYEAPWRIDFTSMRPIVAADIKHYDENNWRTDVSARTGVGFDNLQVLGRKLQVLAGYYNGFSPSGQFYKDKVEYIGVGAQFYF